MALLNESILNHTKRLCNLTEDNHDFDLEMIIYINATFEVLRDLGVGPTTPPFILEDETQTWQDYFGTTEFLPLVIEYVGARCRKKFDPPSGAAMDALTNTIAEDEWRLNAKCDPTPDERERMGLAPLW